MTTSSFKSAKFPVMSPKKDDEPRKKRASIEENDPSETNVVLKGKYQDFIAEYPNVIDDEFSKEIIDAFDYYHAQNSVLQEDLQFSNSNAGRFDWALELANMSNKINGRPERDLNDELFDCWKEYCHVFGHLKDSTFYSTTQKVQKTPAGGGYHVWHDENSNREQSDRKGVWMIYLNDDFEGGETEFLYYKRRIQPVKNTLLIWPAGLTHAHRGGLVTKGTKYVVTGWFNIGI